MLKNYNTNSKRLELICRIQNQGERQSAFASINELITSRPESAIGYQVRSEMYLSASQFDEAEADALRAAELAPGNSRAHATIARARLGKKDVG